MRTGLAGFLTREDNMEDTMKNFDTNKNTEPSTMDKVKDAALFLRKTVLVRRNGTGNPRFVGEVREIAFNSTNIMVKVYCDDTRSIREVGLNEHYLEEVAK